MRNVILLTVAVLASTVLINAQSPDASKAAAKSSNLDTLTGCLQMSTGYYTLVEEDGTSHELSGAARKLKNYVGQAVELTGKPGTRSVSSTPAGVASSVTEHPVFEVKTIKPSGNKCNSGK